ncbi:pentapeptide repeat-containing protein [Spongiactinospora sp. 9N601]|uniref:pentapeptide repeat-containing protein n=1 Tax=Spongiactinospora sp. 9N601 TaxID=3375149 RepID=UPI00378CAA3D
MDGERFDKVLFVDVDMRELADRGAVFNECTFRGVRFNVSSHENAAFINCTFIRCSFFDAVFRDCKLIGGMFDGCTYGLLTVEGGAVIDPAQATVLVTALGMRVRPEADDEPGVPRPAARG